MNNAEPKGKTPTEQLNVRIPRELIRRVTSVAGAVGKSLADFVGETLDERTKEHKADVDKIRKREELPKNWK